MSSAYIVQLSRDSTHLEFVDLVKLLNPNPSFDRFLSIQVRKIKLGQTFYGMVNSYGFCYIGEFVIATPCSMSGNSSERHPRARGGGDSCAACPGYLDFKFKSRVVFSPTGTIIESNIFPKSDEGTQDFILGETKIDIKEVCAGYSQITKLVLKDFPNNRGRGMLSVYLPEKRITKERLQLVLSAKGL